MKQLLTILALLTVLGAKGQTKKDTVRHLKSRGLIFDTKKQQFVRDSTQDLWIKGDSVYKCALNPFCFKR